MNMLNAENFRWAIIALFAIVVLVVLEIVQFPVPILTTDPPAPEIVPEKVVLVLSKPLLSTPDAPRMIGRFSGFFETEVPFETRLTSPTCSATFFATAMHH